jgi:uncharacterized protein with PIN domain
VKTEQPFLVRLRFHGGLDFFLKRGSSGGALDRELKEPTSVKDAIESCGVPHPEIDRILVDGEPAKFPHILRKISAIEVYPIGFTDSSLPGEPLQRPHINRFVADGHLGKLARNLRFLGFDVAYDNKLHDPELLQVMVAEDRALLTRDRRLLMHRIVANGYCPRSADPIQQTVEVVQRFHLSSELEPFIRCIECNAPLQNVNKDAVLDQLEPLTRLYYDEFRRCTGCGKIFWRGSHHPKLESFLELIRAQLGESGGGGG